MPQPDQTELLDAYERASEWTVARVAGTTGKLDRETLCDGWDVRTLLNHVLETQRYFTSTANGEDATPPSATPPDLVGEDPVATFDRSRADLLRAFGEPGAIEKTGPALGIACADQLLHGWDLAKATGQDATMPQGLPGFAFDRIHGLFSDEQRPGVFKPEVQVAPDASAQDKLLAYTGRDPAS